MDQPLDVHHIEPRRGEAYDVPENEIALCRSCHSLIHGSKYPREQAKEILRTLTATPGVTGLALLRRERRAGTQ